MKDELTIYGIRKELARRTGLSTRTIWNYFNGRPVSYTTKICIQQELKELTKLLKGNATPA